MHWKQSFILYITNSTLISASAVLICLLLKHKSCSKKKNVKSLQYQEKAVKETYICRRSHYREERRWRKAKVEQDNRLWNTTNKEKETWKNDRIKKWIKCSEEEKKLYLSSNNVKFCDPTLESNFIRSKMLTVQILTLWWNTASL